MTCLSELANKDSSKEGTARRASDLRPHLEVAAIERTLVRVFEGQKSSVDRHGRSFNTRIEERAEEDC